MSRIATFAALTASAIGVAALVAGAALAQTATPVFTAAQAKRGEATYRANCVACHGQNLDDGQFAAALKGPAFADKWGGKGLDEVFAVMTTQMPPDNPGGLGAQAYADVLAFVMSQNGGAPGPQELPANGEALKSMTVPR